MVVKFILHGGNMRIGVYKSSNGKDIVLRKNYSPEGKAKILKILEILLKEGVKNCKVRVIDKSIKPKLFEIKKDNVRIFFFQKNKIMYITHIIENKQKNRTELTDKNVAIRRIQYMINDPEKHVAWLN